MIVVDTNVIAYLLMPGAQTVEARKAYEVDPVWSAPLLWRSEFRNVLATSVRERHFACAKAQQLMDLATELMMGGEYEARPDQVLKLATESGCSAYDCEFVALAMELGVPLVTADAKLVKTFGPSTVRLTDFS